MDGQMKTLIDRTVPRYTEMTDKEFYYIITAADTERANLEKTVEGLRGFTLDCLDRAFEKGILYGVGVWEKGDILRTPAVQQAYEMGKPSDSSGALFDQKEDPPAINRRRVFF